MVRRAPEQFDLRQTRWTLSAIGHSCSWLESVSLAGVWQIMKRLAIHYKRARSYYHSPDANYHAKLQQIYDSIAQVRRSGPTAALLFLDELSYFRQPEVASDYEERGSRQPLAHYSYRSNTRRRVIATLDVLTGQVVHASASRITVPTLVDFYQQVCDTYPQAHTIYVVQDNWPVHIHPDVVAALRPQTLQWPFHCPANWPTEPSKKARRLNLPIQLLMLPTYASWTNPIEKLWRWLRQDILHLHRYADRWSELHDRVDQFLDQFAAGSDDLLRYVGLTGQTNLYGPALFAQPPPLHD